MQNASAKEWFLDVVCRNARTTALWQAYGFMHGVLVSCLLLDLSLLQNTDNISILGLTIDYGPYAFMDVWDPMHICSESP
jgi:uncharacterized protein YdiU (UPF0061 family)